ncbi:MAG: IclR family transcriptional regulator [Beijerinckiaceae bacterium]
MNELVKTAVRTLGCLEVLATADEGMSLVELASVLDAPKSSLLMLLRTLVDLGYAERTASDRYGINAALKGHELGWIGGPQAVLVRNAHPVMRELTDTIRETCFISVLAADHRLRLLSKVVSPREIRYDIDLARSHVPHKTASGRVQLAYWPRTRLADYVKAWGAPHVASADRVDLAALEGQLSHIRDEGVALLIDEWVAGATGVSAPVFDACGTPIAAVTIGAVTARFLADREEIVQAVKAAGERITASLPDRLRRDRASPSKRVRGSAPDATMGERHAVS